MLRWMIVGTLLGLAACTSRAPANPSQDDPAIGGREMPDREAAAADRLKYLERVEGPGVAGAATGEVPAELLERIRVDAAGRLGVAPGEVAIMRAESVTWSDGSLGCPRPDVLYTQAIEPGYWVVLQAGEHQLDYRARTRGDFVLCESSNEKGLPR